MHRARNVGFASAQSKIMMKRNRGFKIPCFFSSWGKLSTCDTCSFLLQQFHTGLTEQFSASNCS